MAKYPKNIYIYNINRLAWLPSLQHSPNSIWARHIQKFPSTTNTARVSSFNDFIILHSNFNGFTIFLVAGVFGARSPTTNFFMLACMNSSTSASSASSLAWKAKNLWVVSLFLVYVEVARWHRRQDLVRNSTANGLDQNGPSKNKQNAMQKSHMRKGSRKDYTFTTNWFYVIIRQILECNHSTYCMQWTNSKVFFFFWGLCNRLESNPADLNEITGTHTLFTLHST